MAMLTRGILFAVKLLAGIGIGEFLDKFFRDKLPEGITPVSPFQANIPKILKFAAVMAVAFVIINFIARKLKIRILY